MPDIRFTHYTGDQGNLEQAIPSSNMFFSKMLSAVFLPNIHGLILNIFKCNFMSFRPIYKSPRLLGL
jgi:hypothetical protein